MSHYPRYRKFYPKLYQPRVPIFWWVGKPAHVRFITRELTSVAVAFTAVELVFFVGALAEGPAAYAAFGAWLGSPLALVLHAFVLVMLVFHSVTWFNLAPKAMVIRVGKLRVPPWAIAGGNFAAWAAVSAVVAWLLLSL